MKFLKYVQLLSLSIGLAVAHPGGSQEWHDQKPCISDADAAVLVDVIVSLSHSFDPAYVTPFFADDFALQSDSLNWIEGLPVSLHERHNVVEDHSKLSKRTFLITVLIQSGATTFDDKNVLIAAAYNFTTTFPELNPPIAVSFVRILVLKRKKRKKANMQQSRFFHLNTGLSLTSLLDLAQLHRHSLSLEEHRDHPGTGDTYCPC